MSTRPTDIEIEEGICPNCGSDGLEYSDTEFDDYSVSEPYKCLDCDFEGVELYTIEFKGHFSVETQRSNNDKSS